MGYLAAQGAILAIGIVIGLICSVIGLFFGHIILFDSIALGIVAGVCCNSFTPIHPALCLVIGIAFFFAAVMAATYQCRFLGDRWTAYADLCGGSRAAGVFAYRKRSCLGLGDFRYRVPRDRRTAPSRKGQLKIPVGDWRI